jgi:seryl-tRNA synthetase
MHDIRWIRENPDAFDAGLKARGLLPVAAELIAVDAHRRVAQTRSQKLQTERNRLSKLVGQAKGRGENVDALISDVQRISDDQVMVDRDLLAAAKKLEAVLAELPNLPDMDVPIGPDEGSNVEVRRWGEPRAFDFSARDHVELGEGLGMMDFERAARLSGSRFVVLTGQLARLERALAAFMLDLHTVEFGLTEVNPPALVRDEALYGTGQLPKFRDDLFHTTDGRWLIPTAEVPLTNLVADEILIEESLPRRYAALTLCFRSEAGSAGRDTRGMLRQHQFSQVEMVSIVHPDRSVAELERMTGCAEAVLQRLDLPYRVMMLSTGDIGFSARKTYDLEVWLPGQGAFREISSCSNCGDFQARRMKSRFRPKDGKGTQFLHTLNGSGLAIGRALVAVLENNQKADGSIAVPEVLRSYMGGLEELRSNGE